jgi:hypothetical protein
MPKGTVLDVFGVVELGENQTLPGDYGTLYTDLYRILTKKFTAPEELQSLLAAVSCVNANEYMSTLAPGEWEMETDVGYRWQSAVPPAQIRIIVDEAA